MAEVDSAIDRESGNAETPTNRWRHLAWPLGIFGLLVPVVSATLVVLNRGTIHTVGAANVPGVIVPVGFAIIGALLASRRPQNTIGWIFLGIAVFGGIGGVTGQYVFRSSHFHRLPFVAWAAWLQGWAIWLVFPAGLVVFVFLLFPDGRFQSRRWRRLGWLAATWVTAGVVLEMIQPTLQLNGSPAIRNPLAVKALASVSNTNSLAWLPLYIGGLGILIAAMVGAILRTRRSAGELRQQLRWLGYAAGVTAALLVADFIVSIFVPNLPGGLNDLVIVLGFGVAVPVSCGVAILKHGLYDLDFVVGKTVAYGLLAAFFTVVYVAVVVGLGTAIGSNHSPLLTVLAATVIALAFNPVRERAKRLADRLVYGKRATPYEVLSQFSERMAGTYSLDDILPRMARVLADGTGGSAEIWLRVGEVLRSVAVWPDEGEPVASSPELGVLGDELPGFSGVSRATPVLHQSELLGAITVTKQPNDPIRPTEEKLVDDVASQAGLVLFNVRLIEELRASRQRLVKAQDEERRRIERNIHDGAQQQLVALAVKANLAESFVGKDEGKERTLLAELKVESTEALENLRDLARGIYPPLLADKGLAPALASQARKSPIPVAIESDGIGRYPQEIEAAVYFCCLEALQNIAKYAEAKSATVRLADSTGRLTFSVTDDGKGFDPASTGYGTGLQGMADRLDALGGSLDVQSAPHEGTTVLGSVPGIQTT